MLDRPRNSPFSSFQDRLASVEEPDMEGRDSGNLFGVLPDAQARSKGFARTGYQP